jgi:hypothetical protein
MQLGADTWGADHSRPKIRHDTNDRNSRVAEVTGMPVPAQGIKLRLITRLEG